MLVTMTEPIQGRARVLFLAHHFPPIGGVVGRNVATARFLPDYGYEPLVLTGPGETGGRWAPRDARLLERVAGVPSRRVAGPVPGPRLQLPARLSRWTEQRPPDVKRWVAGAVGAAMELEGRFDVLFANLIPYETADAASAIASKLGIPWVADLEDPWALDEMRVHPTAVNRRIDMRRMLRGLASASALIMSCPEAAHRVRSEIPRWRDKVVTSIAHGFDHEDYAGAPPQRTDRAFRVVHTGALHTELGRDHRRTRWARRLLGGTSLDVDILTRSHVYLLEAIERVEAARPELAGRIELHLAGRLTDADREVAGRFPRVTEYGQLPHAETVALARSADLLFVPMHELPEGSRAGLVPCKTYEYLATGRPILAAVPDGDARDLLARFARVSICRPSDVPALAAAIAELVAREGSRWADAAAPPSRAEQQLLSSYERRHLTGRIADVLDEVLAARRGARAGAGRRPAMAAG
jgi:glycosyltransferase involved in cell wall biosynthesis